MDNRPIGLLDSGVGGLTVARELLRQLPMKKLSILEIQEGLLMAHAVVNKSLRLLGIWSIFYFQKM